MAKGGDIIALGKALKTATQQIDRQLPAGLKLVQLQDQPRRWPVRSTSSSACWSRRS
jgi:multidrug efflux pump subunit AcrB